MYETCETAECTIPYSDFDLNALKVYSSLTGPYATVSGYSYATPACTLSCNNQNTTLLALNLATYGPVSIDVNAAVWSDYTSGVLTQSACGAYGVISKLLSSISYSSNQLTPWFGIVTWIMLSN